MLNPFGRFESLPESVREIFMWLSQDVVSLNDKWKLYLGLYLGPDNYDILSEIAQGTFQIVEESLRVDMAALISRLCDKARSCGHDNVSFKALSCRLREIEDLDQKVRDFIRLCDPVVRYRHKRIGHNDLNTLIRPDENVLPGISRDLVTEICEKAGAILNFVLGKYEDTEMIFEAHHRGDAESFLEWLRSAKRYSEERLRKLLG